MKLLTCVSLNQTAKLFSCATRKAVLALSGVILALFDPLVCLTDEPSSKCPENFLYRTDPLLDSLLMSSKLCPTGQKLYCIAPDGSSPIPAPGKPSQGNKWIITKWDLQSGKCEALVTHEGGLLSAPCISPGGSWLLVSSMSLEKVKLSEDHKLLDFRWNDLEMVTTLFSCDQLRKVWTWKHPILALSEIEREDTIFLGNQRLAFLVWHKSQRMSCMLSVWDLQPQVQEVGRFPLVGLEVVPRWPSTYGSYLVIVGTDASFPKSAIAPTYLIIYDARQRTVISKYELGKFKWHREDLLAPEPVFMIGYSPQKNRTVLRVNETIHLYEHGKPVQVIEAPKDICNRQMYADELSPDGRYIAFSSGRVVALYDVDKGDHTIVDKTLEEIHQRWENPPPFSKLAQVVSHPMMRPLMPLMKKLLRWTHLEFTQDGRYLLGITNYGLVVLWDVEQKKRIKSFPIMQGFGTEMNEILGLR